MLLTFGICNSRAGTAARKGPLFYPGRRHAEATVFRRLERRFRQEVVIPTTHVNAGRSRTAWAPADEDAVTADVEWKPRRSSRNIARDLGLSLPRILEVLNGYQLHPYRRVDTCFQTIFLYVFNLSNGYNTVRTSSFYIIFYGQTRQVLRVNVCSTSTTVTSGIILMDPRIWVPNPLQRQRLGWNRWGHCSGPLSATWQADCSTIPSFF
jgi:hypothetical protein